MREIEFIQYKKLYSNTLLKMIEKPDCRTMIDCWNKLHVIDTKFKKEGVRTVITISTEKSKK